MKTIIENGIRVYKDYICHCKNANGDSCGLRIPYPITISGKRNHKYRGIPNVIHGHNRSFLGKQHTKTSKKKNSIAHKGIHPKSEFKKGDCVGSKNNFYGKKHTEESLEKMREAHIGLLCGENHPMYKKYGEDNPNYIDEYNQERHRSNRTHKGFFPLNQKTKIANTQHHIDDKLVVFIARKLHEKNKHSLHDIVSMKHINKIAFAWLKSQGIELQRTLFSFQED